MNDIIVRHNNRSLFANVIWDIILLYYLSFLIR